MAAWCWPASPSRCVGAALVPPGAGCWRLGGTRLWPGSATSGLQCCSRGQACPLTFTTPTPHPTPPTAILQLVKPAHLLSKTVGFEGEQAQAQEADMAQYGSQDRAYEEDPFEGYRSGARY